MRPLALLSSSFAAAVLIATLSAAHAQTSPNAGQIAYNNACRTCHSMREGDNRLGPSLYGIVGKKAGTVSGYGASPAMRESGIVWNEQNLDKFITNPEAVVHGNGMKPYGGIASEEERQKIISYLKSAGGN
jgi:cytochrome c